MAWFDRHIAHYPGVQGGAAVVAGTRTPVGTIVAMHRTYEGDVSRILRGLPHVSPVQVRAALAYYSQHQEEIDDDNRRHERALQELMAHAAR